MTSAEVMEQLKSLGTAQNVKVYKRHGMGDNLYGVSFANLYKLQKKIKTDQGLAEQLWASGNADARSLATLVADPAQMTDKVLDRWVRDIRYYLLADLVARVAGKTRFAQKKMEKWIKSDDEWIGQVGWDILAWLAMEQNDLPDEYFEGYLARIEKDIHRSKNFTRHAMNNALIGIGSRNPALRTKASAAAKRIGKVEVNHGETNCKTPDAVEYINKVWTRKKK